MYVDLQKRESSSSSSYQSQSNSEVESILNTILPPKGWIFGSFFTIRLLRADLRLIYSGPQTVSILFF